jgi:hypothetical protein
MYYCGVFQNIRGTFEKFVDSPYYLESELCGSAVTASFFEVPLLGSDALLTTLHPLLESVLQTVDHFEISCLGAPFSWLEKPRNSTERDLDCMADILMESHRSTFFRAEHRIQFRSRPMRFLGFSNHEKGAPRKEISKRSPVCSTFSRSGWSVVRSASVAKGGTSKKRPSPHLHKVQTRSNKVSPRTLQTALVYGVKFYAYELSSFILFMYEFPVLLTVTTALTVCNGLKKCTLLGT